MNTENNIESTDQRTNSGNAQNENTTDKSKNAALVNRGVKWLVAGIIILLGSFAVTFILYQADMSITTAMYTLNIGGGICVFKGMMDILGF